MPTKRAKKRRISKVDPPGPSTPPRPLKILPPKPPVEALTPEPDGPIEQVDLTLTSSPKAPKPAPRQPAPPPPPPVDADIKYELGVVMSFDGKQVLCIRRLQSINQFNYDDWTSQEVKKASEYADSEGWQTHRKSGSAVLTASGPRVGKKSVTMDVDGPNDWKELQNLVKHQYEHKRVDIQVEYTVIYSRLSGADVPVAPTPPPTTVASTPVAAPPPYTQSAKKQAPGQGRTSTERLRLGLESHQQLSVRIMDQWKCGTSTCKNKEYWCIPFADVHLPLRSEDFQFWVQLIELGQGTEDSPPLKLIERLMKASDAKETRKETRRRRDQERTPPSAETGGQLPFLPYPYGPPPLYSAVPYHHGFPHQSSLTSSPRRPSSQQRNSSPVHSDTDPQDILRAYIRWQVSKAPGYVAQWEGAQEILVEHAFDLNSIKMSADSELLKLGIKTGVVKALKRDINRFEKERKQI